MTAVADNMFDYRELHQAHLWRDITVLLYKEGALGPTP